MGYIEKIIKFCMIMIADFAPNDRRRICWWIIILTIFILIIIDTWYRFIRVNTIYHLELCHTT